MMRCVSQPGPATDPRTIAIPAGAVDIDATLAPGAPLLDQLYDLLRRHGCESGVFHMTGGTLDPFAYVIPALSPNEQHAAYYSETFRPAGPSHLSQGAVTMGLRDGEPFFHCHAFWTESGGKSAGGHILPFETIVAGAIRVVGIGLKGAAFETHADAETGFPLFTPVPAGSHDAIPAPELIPALAVRLKPHEDIVTSLEGVVRAVGWQRARVHGGVGSIIGARYIDAPPVDPFATEMFLTDGMIDPLGDHSHLETGLVDLTGALSSGSLVPEDNPILMTLEVVLTQCQSSVSR